MEVAVTKEFTFDSCHHLNDYVGPCARLHGHTYKLQVTVKGEIDPKTGMIIDFNDLKAIVKDTILDRVDHQNLNEILDYNPTAENMSMDFLATLRDAGLNVVVVKLWETPTSFATAMW